MHCSNFCFSHFKQVHSSIQQVRRDPLVSEFHVIHAHPNSGCSRRNTSRTDTLVRVEHLYRVKSRAKHESSCKPVFTNVVTQTSSKVWAFSTNGSWITCRKEKHGVVHVHGCSQGQSLDGGRVDENPHHRHHSDIFRSQKKRISVRVCA